MKNLDTGIILKDRKYHLKTYRQCFIGREYVTWIKDNAAAVGLKVSSREDAILQGVKMMGLGLMYSVSKCKRYGSDSRLLIFAKIIALVMTIIIIPLKKKKDILM